MNGFGGFRSAFRTSERCGAKVVAAGRARIGGNSWSAAEAVEEPKCWHRPRHEIDGPPGQVPIQWRSLQRPRSQESVGGTRVPLQIDVSPPPRPRILESPTAREPGKRQCLWLPNRNHDAPVPDNEITLPIKYSEADADAGRIAA